MRYRLANGLTALKIANSRVQIENEIIVSAAMAEQIGNMKPRPHVGQLKSIKDRLIAEASLEA